MVQGPGGYRFTDYLKIGLPLGILVGCTALLAIAVLMKLDGTTA
jgi:di/tricarboxylate transporter